MSVLGPRTLTIVSEWLPMHVFFFQTIGYKLCQGLLRSEHGTDAKADLVHLLYNWLYVGIQPAIALVV